MIETLDFSEILLNIEQRLKGYEYVNGQWVRVRTPLLPDDSRAFSKIMAVLYSYIGKHFILSNVSKPFVEVSVSNIYTDLYLDFNKNILEYGFYKKEDIDVILDITIDTILATQTRGIGGREAKLYYSGQSVNINPSGVKSEVRL